MDNPATRAHIVAAWRPFTDAEAPGVQDLLDKAWRRLRRPRVGLPLLTTWVDDGSVDVADVRDVLVDAVVRVLRNPDGYRQQSRTVDDRTVSVTVDATRSAGALHFTADELALLRPTPPQQRSRTVWTLPCH